MSSIKGTKFFGHQVSDYGIENHRVDFLTLSMAFDCVMNNNIINVGEWYLLCGEECDYEGYPLEVYQYYIISRAGSEILHRWTDEIIYYNEELDMVGRLPLRHEAVADKKFEEQLGQAVLQDTLSRVTITAYEPNQLTYEVNSGKGGVVVFSEIYYPGWTATVDGEEQPLGRVNYVLRALQVKPGKHEVVLSFFPKSINRTETIAYTAYGLLLLILLALAWTAYRHRRRQQTSQD